MHVPQRTAILPPAFSLMFPPIVEAHALVGSVAKTSPWCVACSIASSVTTPASTSIVSAVCLRPSPSANSRRSIPPIRFIRSVLITTQFLRKGTAPPVSPVPAPRGIAFSPIRPIAANSGATSSSRSGVTTAKGRCSRQSVASVACATNENGSNSTFFGPKIAPSSRFSRALNSGIWAVSRSSWATSRRQLSSTSKTRWSPLAAAEIASMSWPICSRKSFRSFPESSSSW